MLEIQKTYNQLGYTEVTNFLEAQFNTPPTSGPLSSLMSLILNDLNNEQVTVFIQELYASNQYEGSIMAYGTYTIFIKEGFAYYWTDVQNIFQISTAGLSKFYPGEDVLYSIEDTSKAIPIKSLLITTQKIYGTDFYPITLKSVDNSSQESAGYVTARVTEDGYITSYCLNLKSLNQVFITIANNRASLLTLDIPINSTTVRRCKLTNLGDSAQIPNTPEARAFIDRIKLQGLIYEIS
jgi:hypothetical protein